MWSRAHQRFSAFYRLQNTYNFWGPFIAWPLHLLLLMAELCDAWSFVWAGCQPINCADLYQCLSFCCKLVAHFRLLLISCTIFFSWFAISIFFVDLQSGYFFEDFQSDNCQQPALTAHHTDKYSSHKYFLTNICSQICLTIFVWLIFFLSPHCTHSLPNNAMMYHRI